MKTILVVNSGSTSLKYKLFSLRNLKEIVAGCIENIGQSKSKIKNHEQALKLALRNLKDTGKNFENIKICGHRVVHGGTEFIQPTKITERVIKKLKKYSELAPLHNPANLLGIRASMKILPKVLNIACFDTAFFQDLPEVSFRYGLPEEYFRKYKIRRYGFHGISHRYVAEEAARRIKKPFNKLKIITCHLGGGASIAAIKNGKPIDTSMGFTPCEGLMMMTRSGDLDPIIPLYLLKKTRLSTDDVNYFLNFKSGIYALCGEKNWLRVLERMEKGDKKAKLAFDIYVFRIKKYIGAYTALLSGFDVLVFTGAIGAGKSITRQKICQNLPFLNKVKILAIPTDEEKAIAREILRVF